MRIRSSNVWLAASGLAAMAGCAQMEPTAPQPAGPQSMTFFVTSIGPGRGGDRCRPSLHRAAALPVDRGAALPW